MGTNVTLQNILDGMRGRFGELLGQVLKYFCG